MERWFNIAGPCFAAEHYMLPPERRLGEMMELIGQGRWFSLVSGRQTGKTTAVQWVESALMARGERFALWVDLEAARETPDVADAMRTILDCFEQALSARGSPAEPIGREVIEALLVTPRTALARYVEQLAARLGRPLVLLLDEADGLTGAAMVSFLTQLRELYLARHRQAAPWSVVLVGVRAVRDYTLSFEERRATSWLGTASPFNVTVENVGLAPFSEAEVGELLSQHTAVTCQCFEADAVAKVWWLSQGHPWLVNALADQITRRDVRDRAVAITAEHVERAKETLIIERRTHIDSLAARLQEDRVRRVLDPMLAGGMLPFNDVDADVQYVIGLGLLRRSEGRLVVANPIYREVMVRTLTRPAQDSFEQRTEWYLGADGLLDVPKLMAAWQTFWRKAGHLAASGFTYKESGPHLMLMAFLQRIVNGGGRIEREYALGKGALDLLIEWRSQRVAIEVKLRRDTETEDDALEQVSGYLDSLGLVEGWLVMFDLRSTAPWTERLFMRDSAVGPRAVHIVGC